jgi:hypothetical protein
MRSLTLYGRSQAVLYGVDRAFGACIDLLALVVIGSKSSFAMEHSPCYRTTIEHTQHVVLWYGILHIEGLCELGDYSAFIAFLVALSSLLLMRCGALHTVVYP